MTDEDRLADLLLQWEEGHEHGRDVSAEELCRDCPHLTPLLAQRIHALKVTSWLAKDEDAIQAVPNAALPVEPRTLTGRYRLDTLIGEGGFAQVWKGYDLELRRNVAIKMPKASRLATGERVEHFMAEARRVAGLKHPGVVPVFDVGRESESCFIVSEFVEGGSLAQQIAAIRPTTREAIRVVVEIAETLAYAHQQGFVHRDIKPANILIDHHGRALLADFGVAHSPDNPEAGISFGTLSYMSPEQVQGQAVDHRSDIYSLGIVLYEMLTGHLPHQSSDPVELRRLIVAGTLPSTTSVPKKLEDICRKCLTPNVGDRYQDAGKLAADLRRAAIPPSRRWANALAGVAFVLLLGLAVYFQRPSGAVNNPQLHPLDAVETRRVVDAVLLRGGSVRIDGRGTSVNDKADLPPGLSNC